MAMDFDSWDEGFFSMFSESLDYEYDENDQFEIPEGTLQENEDFKELSNFLSNSVCDSTYDDKKALVQAACERKEPSNNANFNSENKFALPEMTSYSSYTQDSVNVTPTSDASYHFPNGGNLIKTEIERRNSINFDIVNTDQPIIIDARIFLDPYNSTKEHKQVVPTSFISGNTSKLNSTESSMSQNQSENLVERESINTVAHKSSNTVKSGYQKISQKSDSKRMKKRNCVIDDDGKKCAPRKEKDTSDEANNKRKYFSDSRNENIELKGKKATSKTDDKKKQVACSDDKKAKSKHSNKVKKHKSSHEPLNIKIENNQMENESSVDPNVEKQQSKIRSNKKSGTQKIKRIGSDRSSLDRKCKNQNVQIESKVESNVGLSHSASKKEIETLELEPNVTSDIEKEIVDIKQSSSKLKTGKPNVTSDIKKEIVEVKQCSVKPKTEKPSKKEEFSETFNEQESLQDSKSISIVKRENGHLANLKVESRSKKYPPQPRIVLKRLSDYVLHGLSVCTEFLTPKEEILDRKPNLRLNPFHQAKPRVVLKNLTNKDLTSSERLLTRVKSEMNANIARKLKSQGRARDRNYIRRFCCECKSSQVDQDGLSKIKHCDKCGFQLIYLCAKCNEKHYVDYNHVYRHLKLCRGSGETKAVGLNSIVLHRCTECTFKTTHTQVMVSHMKAQEHKANGEVDIHKLLKSEKARAKREGKGKGKGKDDKPEDMPKLPRNKYANLIINQNKTSVAELTECYCTECDEPRSSKTRKFPEPCVKCNKRLKLRCLRCSLKSNYDAMWKHLRTVCCPNSYRCAKCNHEGSMWSMMQQHVWEKHRNSSNRPKNRPSKSSRRRRPKEIFHCELCTFQTNYRYNVGRHLKEVHKK